LAGSDKNISERASRSLLLNFAAMIRHLNFHPLIERLGHGSLGSMCVTLARWNLNPVQLIEPA
jgi:hypothetical protein